MNLIDRIARKTIELSFYALFFFTPLLFTNINSELFELPKMFFVWALTIIIVGAWAVRSITRGQIIFQRTFLDIPLLIFLISQFLSFYFSTDPHTSFWGYYSRFNGGLLSLVSYSLLYWAFVSHLNSSHILPSLRFLLTSALLVSLWGIPAHFGYDPTCALFGYGFTSSCWTEQFKPEIRIFSTLGQPNWLAAWLVAIMPLSWSLAGINGQMVKWTNGLKVTRQSIYLFTYLLRSNKLRLSISLIFLLALFFTNSKSGFLGLGVSVTVFLVGLMYHKVRRSLHVVLPILAMTIVGIVFVAPKFAPVQNCFSKLTNYQLQTTNYEPITSSSDIRCIVWKGAIDLGKRYPLLGTGPETFAFSYYKVKPPEHSLTSEWDHLYNKAHNEYLSYLANTGLFGLLAYLSLIGAFLIYIIKKISKSEFLISKQIPSTKSQLGQLEVRSIRNLLVALAAGWASLLVTNFFGFSVVPTQLQFFLYPALAFTLSHNPPPTTKLTTSAKGGPASGWHHSLSILKRPVLGVVLLSTIYFLLSTFKYYLADVKYNNAQNLSSDGEYALAFSNLKQAIELRSDEPLYYSELSDVLSSLALTTNTDPQTSDQIRKLSEEFSNDAVAASPANINFWKTRGRVFLRLQSLDPDYMQKAVEAFEKGASLAPTDAKTLYNLALSYWYADRFVDAEKTAIRAIALRPTYRDARVLLVEILLEENKKTKAREELESILKLWPQDQEANQLKAKLR